MGTIFRFSFLLFISFYSCKNLSQVHSQRTANKLINESSPYLLQHAYNPVDWHPWGPEALEKAKRENKLLIVSIGYAACHWCHVMEHESFEDSTVAAIMNEHFVSIKVDREERPDVDDIYMSAAQLISGRGGWPLNAFALPDGRPVWAGTYFPKERWMDILKQFADLKQNDYARLESSANQLVSGIKSIDEIVLEAPKDYNSDDIQQLAKAFVTQIDQIDGGRRGAPKFPMPNNYEYLMKYAVFYQDESAKEALLTTLDKMARGGIYDQAGGGFARYSVDEKWLVPHFEKMLYDNGQLISLYSDAYRMTRNPLYKKTVLHSIEFVERELMNDNGRFYSSLDADSDGEEGKFYVWKETEIDELFTDPKLNSIIKDVYNITPEGNWEHGNNILHITDTEETLATRHKVTPEELRSLLAEANERMLNARASRVRPGLDDKILTSWNALMIKGLVDAYKALGETRFLDRAIQSMKNLLKDQMQSDYRLLRNYKDGKASINAFLDDYALTIQSLLALYEVTFDEQWIETASSLMDYALVHFNNEETKMLFYTSDVDPPLIARKTELSDNVIPASNSTMARNLYRLGELYYNQDYIDQARQMLANMWPNINRAQQPSFYSNWLQLQLDIVNPPFEIAISGAEALAKAHEMMRKYRPNAFYLGAETESDLPLLKFKYVEDATMIYVCQNKTCKLPVTEIEEAEKLLQP